MIDWRDQRVGYLGPRFRDEIATAETQYELQALDPPELASAASSLDGLVCEATALADGDVGTALDSLGEIPVVVVGEAEEAVTVPSTLLGHVDEYLDVADGADHVADRVTDLLRERHRNLGMSAEQFVDVFFETAPVHLYVKDESCRHVRWSSFQTEYEDDVFGLTDPEIIDDSLGDQSYADDQQVVTTGEPIFGKEEYYPPNDDWSLTSKVPVYDDGEIVGLVGATWIITQRKEYAQRLERQNQRLERFVRVVSHDLRNPLEVALGRTRLLEEDLGDHPEGESVDDHVAAVERSLERMDALIDDLLELARQGESVSDPEPVDLAGTARDAWRVVDAPEATLEVADDGEVRADPSRLQQLLENLLRNSVEHGGPDVTVRVGPLGSGDGFFLADDGSGIPADEREQVVAAGYSTSESGTGLGLSIVREIAEAHGWTIRVDDSDRGGARIECVEAAVERASDDESVSES